MARYPFAIIISASVNVTVGVGVKVGVDVAVAVGVTVTVLAGLAVTVALGGTVNNRTACVGVSWTPYNDPPLSTLNCALRMRSQPAKKRPASAAPIPNP